MSRKGYTPEGLPVQVSTKSFAKPSFTLVSIDYSNIRTWWYKSVRNSNISVVPDVSGKIYDLPDSDIINIYELTDGENPSGSYSPNEYKVQVFKDGTELLNMEYGYESGSTAANTTGSHMDSYTVDYQAGSIIFDNDQSANSIEASYSVPGNGSFLITPPTDKEWKINHIELQFSVNIDPWPAPMEFVLGINNETTGYQDFEYQIRTYRGMRDIFNMANIGNIAPSTGVFNSDIYQIPFNYISGFTIIPKGEMITTLNTVNYIELRMKYGIPLTGTEIGTASFYIFEEDLV